MKTEHAMTIARVASICAVLCVCLLAAEARAQPQTYVAGLHYQELAMPLPDPDADRYDVAELFWYGCPVCYDLLPTSQIWESSYRTTDMTFSRLPAVWNEAMAIHAQLFLTARELGLLPEVNKSSWEAKPGIHAAIFEAIHVGNNPLSSVAEAATLFEQWGVSPPAFDIAWNSKAVSTQLATVKSLAGLDEVPGLPALVVDGRYVVTFNEAVTTTEELYKVVNFLIVQLREVERRGAAAPARP